MSRRTALQALLGAALVVGGSLLGVPPALADDATYAFDAGEACTFPLTVTASGELKGPSGRLSASGSRELTAGRGRTLRFANTASGADLEVAASGSVSRITSTSASTYDQTLSGHNVLILYPTDVPAGPSTTLYIGKVTFHVDRDGVFTVTQKSGSATDICALLS